MKDKARETLEAIEKKWEQVSALYRDSANIAGSRGNKDAQTKHMIISQTYARHAEQLRLVLDAWEQE